VTTVQNLGPGAVRVGDNGQLNVTVPIGYTGNIRVVVGGFAQNQCSTQASGAPSCPSGTQPPIQQTIQIPVVGPQPPVVPNARAALLPRAWSPDPGEVVVVGMDGEVGLNWRPQPGADYYVVSSGGDEVCMTIYSSCIVPAPNRRSRSYVVTGMSETGKSVSRAAGTGWANQSGTSLAAVYFEPGSARLTPAAIRALRQMVRDAQALGIPSVYVVGHTDTLGSMDYNRRLSARRARAVHDWIEKNFEDATFDGGSLQGEINPKFPEASRPGDWRNRRVDIRVK